MVKQESSNFYVASYEQDKATFESPEFSKYINKNYQIENNIFPEELSETGLKFFNVKQKNYKIWVRQRNEKLKELDEEEKEKLRFLLGEVYEKIYFYLKEYLDMKEEYYHLVTLWIIGTYYHKEFISYPYLFINAMRGSGKTRLLKIIKSLSWNGELLTSVRESTLFRSAGNNTICIDEFEGVMKKENAGLREILNASYKKGMTIKRMIKKKTNEGEKYVVENFEPYTPIAMANIWGVEEVLADRSITMILEKSYKNVVSKKVEDFDNDISANFIKNSLNLLKNTDLVKLCSFFSVDRVYKKWNFYINSRYSYTTTDTTQTTSNTENTLIMRNFSENCSGESVVLDPRLEEFFVKIDNSEINGRDLEMFMPLYIIGRTINQDIFQNILKISQNLTKEKKVEEMTESRDVMLMEFISLTQEPGNNFIKLNYILNHFRNYVHDDDKDYQWLNSRWLGRALKRLNLLIDKRRVGDGIEIILDVHKAKEKAGMFKR